MGGCAGEKVDHRMARRGAFPRYDKNLPLDRIKICCADKNGPPPGGCLAEICPFDAHRFLGKQPFHLWIFCCAIQRQDRRVRYVERVSQRSGNPEAFDVVVL